MNVLIADDSAMVRRNIRQLLTTLGTVSSFGEADTVAATIETVGRDFPDVLILDLHFPDGSGFDVLQYLEAQPSTPVVIVLTTFSGPLEQEKAIKMGAHHFLDKATEYEELFELLAAPKMEDKDS